MDEPPSIDRHLREWLGSWPPSAGVGDGGDAPGDARSGGTAGGDLAGLDVVGWPARTEPGWDGGVHAVVGVFTPGGGVLSVPPATAGAVRDHLAGGGALRRLPEIVGRSGGRWIEGLFRYSTAPTELPDAGIWLPAGHAAVPRWLRPFGGEVLVVLDGAGVYLAGVGLKKHDRYGQEIAVGTEPAARGQGLARRLVTQAARAVLAVGAVPTYLHALDNVASGRVAEAAGFPDIGWRTVGVIGGAP